MSPIRAQQADAGGLIVDEGAAAAVGADDAAQHQPVAAGIEAGLGKHGARRMLVGEREFGGDHRLRRAGADQAAFGAQAQRQAERVEQDRFAGAGLAGQHAQARPERQDRAGRSAPHRGWQGPAACAR